MTLHLPAADPAASTLTAALETAYRDHRTRSAVVTASRRWTYEDLASNAHAVAAGVRIACPRGPGRPAVVAVILERSPEFVATVLGVLAAGAVYLPLDPDAPDAYLRQVLVEARPALVVTSTGRESRLRAAATAPVCTYADLIGQTGAGHVAGQGVEPSDPAYVIYTSGSTGSAKGVLVPHSALLNSTAARVDRYGPAGRVLLLHSPAFDLTTGVLFWTVLTGGTLVIDPARLADVAATVDLVHRHRITHLIYPASLYSVFLDRAADRPPATLTAVGIGSERWSPVLIERHAALIPHTSLVNEFGPTEACVCSSYGLMYDAASGQQAPMSIGRPVRNTGYLLLDGDGRPTTGPGELGITGANLALGYLDRPELTRERFVTIDGERVYRTGDLAQQDPDGNFVFLERADRQVQIGGHRVEPGHVETVLMTHHAVLQAHVTTRTVSSGADSAVLVAYVVPTPGPDSPERTSGPQAPPPAGDSSFGDECARYLRERLPAYLVPSTFVVLSALPQTLSGKIDVSRLPDPAAGAGGSGPEPDGDPLPRRLAAMAAEILGVPHVPVDRSLPTLGANSLALIRLAAAIAADFGVDVPISALFSARTIAQIADLVGNAAPAARTLPRTAGPEGRFPLSGQQRQIWVLTQLAPDTVAYNTQFSLLLQGPVDVDALQAALTRIVVRHEILRTTFHDGPDGPFQVVHEPWPATIDVVDLTVLTESEREADLADRMRAAVGTGFDVSRLPLVRWHLFRLAPDVWQLLQVEHHFAHDGWSAQLFLAELRDAYQAMVAGAEPALPDLPAQYRDFAAWYHGWRRTGDFADQVAYWRNHLEGCPADGATFTPDRARPAVRSFRGGRLSAHIPATVMQGLDELAGHHEVSRFAVFLSAFALQVWQHTGERDIVVGSALLNRRQPRTDRLLGMFVNALPLRVRVDPDASVGDLLRATMNVLLGAQDHQELPLLDLLANLDRPRDPGRNPLFNLMFAFHDTPRPRLRMGPVQAQLVIEHNATAKGDLNVVCVPDPRQLGDGPGGMTILWEYDTDLFEGDTAAELLSGFETILRLLSRSPEGPVRDLDLLGAEQTARIVSLSTGPVVPVPFRTLHAGFDAAADAHPDAVAFERGGSRWTYRHLSGYSTMVQRQLTAHGVRSGSVVAVMCPAGIEVIATILAVLRCGAMYVCLDPDQPQTRTVTMLDDAQVDVVVTIRTAAVQGAVEGRTVVYADALPIQDEPASAAQPADAEVGPNTAAYLVFTSGSTGLPKAVVATHRNACTAVHARTRFLQTAGTPTGAVRTLVTLPVIFDVGPHMMLWTLWSGGTVVVPDEPVQAQDPDQVLGLIERSAITHVNFTASFYRHLLTGVPVGWRPALRVVAVGGEACRGEDVRDHATRLPAVALDHEYGPTEGTVWCAAQRLHPAPPGRVTVGGPLANYTMTVLSPGGNLLPVGAAGELSIGGDGVAAGYHRRPGLTAERFITVGTGPLAGRRLYRTGDRARLTTSGFEILGRSDDQVKIRGFRVELGEIGSCLLQHPAVTDAAVLVHGAGDTAKLVAYVANPDAGTDLPERLRTWVAQRLPSYMAPAVYVITDRLPRTATGKIQRGDLPPLPETATHAAASEPVTDRQRLLLEVWRETLQRPTLGIDDNFFDCGGDSLQAIQAAALAAVRGVTLSVTDLLAAPTVRALDGLLTGRAEQGPDAVAERRPAGTELALTPIQMWFFEQRFGDPDHFHQARLFDVAGHCDRAALRTALTWVTARHDAFRTRFTATAHTWSAVLDDGLQHRVVQEHALPGGARPLAERLDGYLRALHELIGINSGRLAVFAVVHDEGSGRTWLYLIAHHLIVDVVSWQIITGQIEHAYRLLQAGRQLPEGVAPGIPANADASVGEPLPDVSRWQALATAAKPRLPGVAAGVPAATVAERLRVCRRLSARAGWYLRHDVSRLHGIGAPAVLLAALHRAVGPISDGAGLYVWLENNGRTRTSANGLEHVVGWLTCLYPELFTPVDVPPARLVDAAVDIHRQLTEVPDSGAGFGEVVFWHQGSALQRQLSGTELPQITFNYLGHQQSLSADRLLEPAPVPEGATIGAGNVLPTPFDLTVAPTAQGTVTCHFSVDPAIVAGEDLERVADRFVAEIETAARMVPLTTAPVTRPAGNLFMIHPVDGRIDWYTPLADALGQGWNCYGLPHDNACDDTTMNALARRYLAQIRAALPSGPYTLVGWCMGAPLAYEIAAQAYADGDGDRIEDMVLMDPPRVEPPPSPDTAMIGHMQIEVPHQTKPAIADALAATDRLPIPDRAAALVDLLGPAGRSVPDHPLLGRMRMRLSFHAAMHAWRPATQLPRLRLLLPAVVTPGNEDAGETWRHLGATVTITTIPGDHESMLTAGELLDAVTSIRSRRQPDDGWPAASNRAENGRDS